MIVSRKRDTGIGEDFSIKFSSLCDHLRFHVPFMHVFLAWQSHLKTTRANS